MILAAFKKVLSLYSEGPPVVYACDELRKEKSAIERCAPSSPLYITLRVTLQDSHFPIIPHSARSLLPTLMDQMG